MSWLLEDRGWRHGLGVGSESRKAALEMGILPDGSSPACEGVEPGCCAKGGVPTTSNLRRLLISETVTKCPPYSRICTYGRAYWN